MGTFLNMALETVCTGIVYQHFFGRLPYRYVVGQSIAAKFQFIDDQ